MRTNTDDVIKLHDEVLYPTVRITAGGLGGSGTVVYSSKDNSGKVTTIVMTNHHVIGGCIEVRESWDSHIGQERKKEYKQTVSVDFFKYNNYSRCIGSFSIEGDILAYDADQDMALIKLRDKERIVEHVAHIFDMKNIDDIHVFDNVFSVGAALSHSPIPTEGRICHMDDEISNYRYWLVSAASVYGVSGGSIYRYSYDRDIYEYVGIPSMVQGITEGFSDSIVYHMGYAIPIDRIIEFWNDSCYQYIYDPNISIEECDKKRDKMKKDAEHRLEKKVGVVEHEN